MCNVCFPINDYIPRNMSEIYSIIHDKAYDAAKAKGKLDAILNARVLGADANLVIGNIGNIFKSSNATDKWRSAVTAIGFGSIYGYKSSLVGMGVSAIYNAVSAILK